MKRFLFTSLACAVMATSALGGPSLGWWNEGDARTTHQRWDFTNAGPDGGQWYDYKAFPESQDNPTSIGQAFIHGTYDGATAFAPRAGETFIDVHLEIGNFPDPLVYKEIWVDLGFTGTLDLSLVDVDGDGQYGPYTAVVLQGPGPGTGAVFGARIYPNPAKEDIWFTIGAPVGGGNPSLDWIHVDTICIPAPGAILLGSIGVGLVGWMRRRKTL